MKAFILLAIIATSFTAFARDNIDDAEYVCKNKSVRVGYALDTDEGVTWTLLLNKDGSIMSHQYGIQKMHKVKFSPAQCPECFEFVGSIISGSYPQQRIVLDSGKKIDVYEVESEQNPNGEFTFSADCEPNEVP